MNAEDNVDQALIFTTTYMLRKAMRDVPEDYHGEVLMYAVDAHYLQDMSVMETVAHYMADCREGYKDDCEAICYDVCEAVSAILSAASSCALGDFMEWTEIYDVEAIYNERYWILRVDGGPCDWH